MGLALREGPSGKLFEGTADGQALVWDETTREWVAGPAPGDELTYWVFVELYLSAAGGDLRTAISLAHAAHTAAGTTFVLPGGTYAWVGTFFQPRNATQWLCDGCTIELNQAGVASGQKFIFLRIEAGATHAANIRIVGGVWRFLDVLTSFFSAAIQFEAASNCSIEGSTAQCTLNVAATQGRIRWGFNLLGGDPVSSPTSGRFNYFMNCRLSFSQIQGCGGGRNGENIWVENTVVDDANDVAVSVVSSSATGATTLSNVTIRNTECHNVAGSTVVFAGSDGAGTAIGPGTVENIEIDGVWLNGQRSTPDLDFPFSIAVQVCGGLTTRNVAVKNVGTRLVPNASLQARSVQFTSQDDEVSTTGLTFDSLLLGTVTSNDPLEPLFISGRNVHGVTINNVTIPGLRGIRIVDCDNVAMSNVNLFDGELLVIASTRNLSNYQIAGCNFTRTTGFQAPILFNSTAARSFTGVMLDGVKLNGNGVPLTTDLGGGTMQMWLANIDNTSGSNPTAETLAGIIRLKNVRGFIVPVVKTVAVPAVLIGQVGYVVVSMAATRLSDVAVQECVVANAQAQLVAAGAGGAYSNARVSVAGSIELSFVGPLAGGNFDFTFDRAA